MQRETAAVQKTPAERTERALHEHLRGRGLPRCHVLEWTERESHSGITRQDLQPRTQGLADLVKEAKSLSVRPARASRPHEKFNQPPRKGYGKVHKQGVTFLLRK